MFKWFLNWLEKKGQCKVYVDPLGRIITYRYYLFGVEPNESDVEKGLVKPRWWPNIWIHKFPVGTPSPDGGNLHIHPWATLTIILSGAYKEELQNKGVKWNKTGNFIFRKSNQGHRIIKGHPKKDAYSLFAHWFRKHNWHFNLSSCNNICDYCVQTNKGFCKKENIKMTYTDYHNQLGDDIYSEWLIYDDSVKKKILKRQKAVERAGIKIPTNKELEHLIQTRSKLAREIFND